jgi:putative Holliday junction resolvase
MTPIPGKLLGIDYGGRIIGLATCDRLGIVATPLGLLKRKSKKEDFARIAAIVARIGAHEIICGLPLPTEGFDGYSMADTVRLWASRLAAAVPVPVRLWDESLTSDEAAFLLEDSGARHGERIDDAAAAVILQSYLDALREGFEAPPAVEPARDTP